MTINDAKKILFDRVNIEIEATELKNEIHSKEKQVKKLTCLANEMQMQYDDLANSGMRMFFLGLLGKKEERLQEAQNEIRRIKGEGASTEFELNSMKDRLQEIEETIKEIQETCENCLDIIAEADGETIRTKIVAISEIPRLCLEISSRCAQTKPHFSTAYDIFQTRTIVHSRPSAMEGTFNNRDSDMRKQSKLIENGVNHIIELLNTYNQYAPEEIKIEFHDKWMDKENYWADQVMADDSLARIKKVEDWFCRLDNCWNAMGKQQREAIHKLQEEVLAYLDD